MLAIRERVNLDCGEVLFGFGRGGVCPIWQTVFDTSEFHTSLIRTRTFDFNSKYYLTLSTQFNPSLLSNAGHLKRPTGGTEAFLLQSLGPREHRFQDQLRHCKTSGRLRLSSTLIKSSSQSFSVSSKAGSATTGVVQSRRIHIKAGNIPLLSAMTGPKSLPAL